MKQGSNTLKQSERIQLIPYSDEYLPYFRKWLKDDFSMYMMFLGPFTDEQIDAWPTAGDQITLLVKNKDGEIIGFSDFHHFKKETGIAKHGTFIDPAFRGRGYGKLTLFQSIQYGFNELGLERIEVAVREENRASKKNIESNGFVFEKYDPEKKKYHYFINKV